MTIIGKIASTKAYQTTDGIKFVGEWAEEKAALHQKWINETEELVTSCKIPKSFLLKMMTQVKNIPHDRKLFIDHGPTSIEMDIEKSTIDIRHSINTKITIKSILHNPIASNVNKVLGNNAYKKLKASSIVIKKRKYLDHQLVRIYEETLAF